MVSMQQKRLKILIIDDDEIFRLVLREKLQKYGDIYEAATVEKAVKEIDSQNLDIALVDMSIEKDLDGIELIKCCSDKGIYSIVFSGHGCDQVIEQAYKAGCQDYFQKGSEGNGIQEVINKFLLNKNRYEFEAFIKNDFLTKDEETIKELEFAYDNATHNIPILISGDTGTGKTMLARLLHNVSKKQGNFVQINCSEINPNLVESELFGHVEGAFTGAISKKIGRLKLADQGTLFLDEICSMPKTIQIKLLKAIEEKSFYPVGSDKPESTNIRIISASQKDIIQEIQKNNFRSDLYHRISGINIFIKPLHQRKCDISLIVKSRIKTSRRIIIKKEALQILQEYRWPGNVRELLTTIEILRNKNKGIINADDLPKEIKANLQRQRQKNLITPTQLEYAYTHGLTALIEQLEIEIFSQCLINSDNGVRPTMKKLKIGNRRFYSLKNKISFLKSTSCLDFHVINN